MIIEQIHLKNLVYPVEELRVLSEDEDVYVMYNLSDSTAKTFGLADYNCYRVRPLSWFIKKQINRGDRASFRKNLAWG